MSTEFKHPEELMTILLSEKKLDLSNNKDKYISLAKEGNPEGITIVALYFKKEFESLAKDLSLPDSVCKYYNNTTRVEKNLDKKDKSKKILFPPIDIQDFKYLPYQLILNLLISSHEENEKAVEFITYIEDVYIKEFPYTKDKLKRAIKKAKDGFKQKSEVSQRSETFTTKQARKPINDIFVQKELKNSDVDEMLKKPQQNKDELLNFFIGKESEEIAQFVSGRENEIEIIDIFELLDNNKNIVAIIKKDIEKGNISTIAEYLKYSLANMPPILYDELRSYIFSNTTDCITIIYRLSLTDRLFEDLNILEGLYRLENDGEKLIEVFDKIYTLNQEYFYNKLLQLLQILKSYKKIDLYRKINSYLSDRISDSAYSQNLYYTINSLQQIDEKAVIDILVATMKKLQDKKNQNNGLIEELKRTQDDWNYGLLDTLYEPLSNLESILHSADKKIKILYLEFREALSNLGFKTMYDTEKWLNSSAETFKAVKQISIENKYENYKDSDKVFVTSLGMKSQEKKKLIQIRRKVDENING